MYIYKKTKHANSKNLLVFFFFFANNKLFNALGNLIGKKQVTLKYICVFLNC